MAGRAVIVPQTSRTFHFAKVGEHMSSALFDAQFDDLTLNVNASVSWPKWTGSLDVGSVRVLGADVPLRELGWRAYESRLESVIYDDANWLHCNSQSLQECLQDLGQNGGIKVIWYDNANNIKSFFGLWPES